MTTSPKANKRTVPSKDSIIDELTELSASILTEIEKMRESDTKISGIKFLRSVNKQIGVIKGHANRIKERKKIVRAPGAVCWFKKPVPISKELSVFCGWKKDDLKSRTDVTRYICDYIKEKDLQNPEDRRKIIPDPKLKKLLGYNPKTDDPLTYPLIQRYMKVQEHFVKVEG